jgi:single-strand DNA-binding protein
VIAEYCHKGDPIFIEGRLQLDSWEGQDGQKRSRMRVVAENFQFLNRGTRPGGPPNEDRGAAPQPPQGQRPQPRPPAPPGEAAPEAPAGGAAEDDVPF